MAFLLLQTTLTPAYSEKYSIEVFLPPTRNPPIKVYWDYSSIPNCPRKLSETIFETVKVAMVMLRKSIYRFAEESDGRYDELVRIRFENTSRLKDSHIVVRVNQLGEGVAGKTTISFVDGNPNPPYIVEIDCEVPLSGTVPAFNVVLHELLHSLGLGHTKHYLMPDGGLEIMAEAKPVEREPTIYVSTLDLYALYKIFFTGYLWGRVKDVVEIDSDRFGYSQVTPYLVEFDVLRKKYDELSSKYSFLERGYMNLSRDLETVSINVKSLESSFSKMNLEVQSMSKSISSISTKLSEEAVRRMRLEEDFRENMSIVGKSLKELGEENVKMNESIARLGEEALRLSLSLKQAYMEIDILRGQNIMLTLLALAALVVAVAEIPFIVKSAERRGEKTHEPERGGG
jgi:prefoldin subunit 5